MAIVVVGESEAMIPTQAKERPLLFKGEMVVATLEDRKTSTRRVMKPQPLEAFLARGLVDAVPQWPMQDGVRFFMRDGLSELVKCPYGKPGDRLWVKETFSKESDGRIVYRADKAAIFSTSGKTRGSAFYLPSEYEPEHWKPSIFMPRWASRITLEIVSVRVERLQDITSSGIISEGACPPQIVGGERDTLLNVYWIPLWDSINSKTFPWKSNPWVWRIEFRRIKP